MGDLGDLSNFVNVSDKWSIMSDNKDIKYEDIKKSASLNNPKISIIIPCYNVSKYINKCLESIFNQTFRDFEVICIDDGSIDNTYNLINDFRKNDERIKLLKQENAGPSKARNIGLDLAKGEFIAFIDADDWIDKDYLEKLLEAIERNNCDIAPSTIIRKRKNSQKYRVCYTEEKVYSTLQDKIEISKIPTCCYIWNKLYRADKIKNFKFKEGIFFEDVIWIPEVLKNTDKLVTVPNINYYYRVNKNSIVKKLSSEKKQNDSYYSKKYIIDFFKNNNLKLSYKYETITRRINYFLNIPVLKIKEYKNTQTFYLFGFLPIFKIKNNYFNFLNLIKYRNIDSHHVFKFLNVIIRKKTTNPYIEKRIAASFGLNQEKRKDKIVVSLTTFPERINKVSVVINQLLTQSLKPDKLILWLAKNQFPNKEKDLPDELLNLKQYGLTIGWCEDLRSYKKLIPTLKEHKNDIIITFDDDIYYEKNSIEKLYNAYLKNKNAIQVNRYSKLYFKNNKYCFYKAKELYFDNQDNSRPKFSNTIIGCGGVLYPANSLHSDVLLEDKFKKIIPTQDDIWFWAMAVLDKTPINIVDGFNSNLVTIEDTQQFGLCKSNNKSTKGMSGQEALDAVLKAYPSIVEILKEDEC